ncbi:MAG TPA: 5-deoxy-glucuronate isomerase [Candidatus Hydrogenedentes bacterium]|nr:5-deoxy-glucuronate isomerase [Candidatus Hydrogenedentota bacterium]
MQYTAENMLIHPETFPHDPGLLLDINPGIAGWEFISFQARKLDAGETWSSETGECEFAFVNISGRYAVETSQKVWRGIGGRKTPFEGPAHVLYLPRRTQFTVTAEEAGEFAVAWVPTDEDHEPFLIPPKKVPTSIRGGDNVSRQINDLLPPGSPVHRLVLVEVYTPSGNWSSYPPHKHDVHIVGENGALIESDLEEVYYYKFDRPEGYAYQRVYTDEHCPLHKAEFPIDAVMLPTDGCAVLVPEGYHPVASPPGYTTYYLNILAGSAQSLANQDDPRYSWVKDTYTRRDDRLPLF